MTAVSSYRDPENLAVHLDSQWYRVASADSAEALDRLRTTELYTELVSDGWLLDYEPVTSQERTRVLATMSDHLGKSLSADSHVFKVPTVDPVTYPWEWTDDSLAAAGLLTLRLRSRLLEVGLDLKDASAFNIQFQGMKPFLMDIGSIESWVPNPSWNALKQYVENFINPLAVGQHNQISAANTWGLVSTRGLPSSVARAIMSRRKRLSPGLALLQLATIPRRGRETSETRYRTAAEENPQSALKATMSLTKRLEKHTHRFESLNHETTWANYGSRDHYSVSELNAKTQLARQFVDEHRNGTGPVLDVGGNDGMTAIAVAESTDLSVVVLDPDSGALEQLTRRIPNTSGLRARIQPLRGDLTNPIYTGGLLGIEFSSLFTRIRPSAVLCQAVLHHVVITQAVPMPLAVRSLSQFGAPLQIEFATEDDPKVQLLISQIPHWRGSYNQDQLVNALRNHYSSVRVVGESAPTRVVINAWN